MTSKIEARLAELGLSLPPATQPLNAYQNVVIVNELAFVAGQAPITCPPTRLAAAMEVTCSVEAIFKVSL